MSNQSMKSDDNDIDLYPLLKLRINDIGCLNYKRRRYTEECQGVKVLSCFKKRIHSQTSLYSYCIHRQGGMFSLLPVFYY